MAGFNAFEDDFNQANLVDEEDPAADFLAREQDELAGLDDDNYMVNGGVEDAVGYDDYAVTGEQVMVNGADDNMGFLGMHTESQFSSVQPKFREEPEKIRIWREEQKKRLEEKDAEEEKKKAELRESAKRELDEWYRHHTEQIEKTKSQNREASKNAEKEYVMDRDETASGQEWERIAKLCDFNPKSSKNAKDVSRMRSIILQLKQTPLVR